MNEQQKKLRKVQCQNKEEALKQLGKFINKECGEGGVHIFHKIKLICGCSKCGSTFTVDENIMKTVDIDRLINEKN